MGKLALVSMPQDDGHLRLAVRCPEITAPLLVGPLAGSVSTYF